MDLGMLEEAIQVMRTLTSELRLTAEDGELLMNVLMEPNLPAQPAMDETGRTPASLSYAGVWSGHCEHGGQSQSISPDRHLPALGFKLEPKRGHELRLEAQLLKAVASTHNGPTMRPAAADGFAQTHPGHDLRQTNRSQQGAGSHPRLLDHQNPRHHAG